MRGALRRRGGAAWRSGLMALCLMSCCVAGVVGHVGSVTAQDAAGALSAEALLEKIDDLYRADASHSVMEMHIKTANYERSMSMEGWSKGKDRSLVRVLKPLKEKGTATLMSDATIYTYLPRTDRTIRVSSGMMGSSWMGSHFTNDDLVKESRMSEDYTFVISFRGERAGEQVIEVTLTPRPDAPVSWAKVVMVVRAADSLPISQVFYDEDGAVARTMRFSEVRDMGGRKVPTVMRVVPGDKPGEYTEVRYKTLEFGVEIADRVFSVSHLKRR